MKQIYRAALAGLLITGILCLAACGGKGVTTGSGSIILTSSEESSDAVSSEAVSSEESAEEVVSSEPEAPSEPESVVSDAAPAVTIDSSAEPIKEETPDSYIPFSTGTSVGDSDNATLSNYIVDCTALPTYERVTNEIAALEKAYPELINVGEIGKSVQNRTCWLVKLGSGTKKACVVAGIHSREFITVNFALRCIEDYANAYYSESGLLGGYNIKNLLDEYTLYIVPNCNPDGSEIIFGLANPMVNVTAAAFGDFKANANGVNLNRNFPFLWYKSNTNCDHPDAALYIGESAGSEPETQNLMKLCQINSFEWMLSLHIWGDCIYWSDAVNNDVAGSSGYITQLCSKLGFYACPTSTDLSLYGGGFENWFRANCGKPGFCVELMPLSVTVSPTDNRNLLSFDSSVRYSVTRCLFAAMMQG